MPTLRLMDQADTITTRRTYLSAAAYLLKATFWIAYVGALIFADVDLWAYVATAIIAIPAFAICSVMLRARLGILR